MPLSIRSGNYGNYWGNDFASSKALNMDQMKLNAEYIYNGLSAKGFTKESICGMLGNIQTESTINPGRWESDRVGGHPKGHGYGLVQWTPYNKYTNWCNGDPSTMDNNLERINYEVENGIQWIKTKKYPLTFRQFKTSTDSPDYLANAFLTNYERPRDPIQPRRGRQALFWYDFLNGVSPQPSPTPTPTPEKSVINTRKWLAARCFRINIRG